MRSGSRAKAGGSSLTLTDVLGSLAGIDNIDLTASGNQTLIGLDNLSDFYTLTDNAELYVTGNAGDKYFGSGINWVATGNTVTLGGNVYNDYSAAGGTVHLYLDTDISVNGVV